MPTELVRYSVIDAVAEIVLDRGPVNALNIELIDALLASLDKARHDASVRAVIISSAPKVFCAGLDLDIEILGLVEALLLGDVIARELRLRHPFELQRQLVGGLGRKSGERQRARRNHRNE